MDHLCIYSFLKNINDVSDVAGIHTFMYLSFRTVNIASHTSGMISPIVVAPIRKSQLKLLYVSPERIINAKQMITICVK